VLEIPKILYDASILLYLPNRQGEESGTKGGGRRKLEGRVATTAGGSIKSQIEEGNCLENWGCSPAVGAGRFREGRKIGSQKGKGGDREGRPEDTRSWAVR